MSLEPSERGQSKKNSKDREHREQGGTSRTFKGVPVEGIRLGKGIRQRAELALIPDSEKWFRNFARGGPLKPVLFSLPQEATSTISPRPCTKPWQTCCKLRNPDPVARLRHRHTFLALQPLSTNHIYFSEKTCSPEPHCKAWSLASQGTGERGWGLGT